jgi:hypothetical protein
MKTMNKFLFCGLFILANSLSAQYSFRVKSYNEINLETRETISTREVNQIFNVSLRDNYLVHNVLDEYGNIEDSQLYKIIKQEKRNDLLWLSCESGVTGNVYEYIVNEDEVSGPQLFYFNSGTLYLLDGSMTRLKTYRQ